MDYENELKSFTDKISQNEILKLRKSYNDNGNFDNYYFKAYEKIFKKLIFPYLRFEILLNCIRDIKDNKKYYSKMKIEEIKRVNIIFEKLQRICLYLNFALD